jgi:hypothetical protein
MVALVLQCFGSGKVHWGGAIIAAVSASGVACHVGSRQGCLGGSRVGIIMAAREVGMASDSVVEFHT